MVCELVLVLSDVVQISMLLDWLKCIQKPVVKRDKVFFRNKEALLPTDFSLRFFSLFGVFHLIKFDSWKRPLSVNSRWKDGEKETKRFDLSVDDKSKHLQNSWIFLLLRCSGDAIYCDWCSFNLCTQNNTFWYLLNVFFVLGIKKRCRRSSHVQWTFTTTQNVIY